MLQDTTATLRLCRTLFLSLLLVLNAIESDGDAVTERELLLLTSRQQRNLIQLHPFDVEIRRLAVDLNNNEIPNDISVFELTDIVASWLKDYFTNAAELENFARLDTLVLNALSNDGNAAANNKSERRQRNLQPDINNANTTTFQISYEGVTVWTKEQDDEVVPETSQVVELQNKAFETDEEGLLQALQAAEVSNGLGEVVVDVEASIEASSAPSEAPLAKRPTVADIFTIPSASPSGAPSRELQVESSMPSSEFAMMDESQVPTMFQSELPSASPTTMTSGSSERYRRYSFVSIIAVIAVALWGCSF